MIDGTDIRQLDPREPAPQYRRGDAGERAADRLGAREYRARPRPGSTTRRWSAPPSFPAPTSSWARSPTATTCRLADRGEGLSGGQRQSIAIARALAGRPPVLVIDEPSSAMDAQTETALIQRLQEELKGRTLILITHRPPLLALVSGSS